MIFSKKKTSKKVVAFYLAVAFFFTFFSFGKITSATSLYSQDLFSTVNTYSQVTGVSIPTLQGMFLNQNQNGMTGNVESFTFYSTTSDWPTVFDEGGSGFLISVDTCTVAWTIVANQKTCTGTGGSPANSTAGGAYGGSISNSGNYWTVTFPSGGFSLDSSKYYALNMLTNWYSGSYVTYDFDLGGISSGTCYATWYNYQTGVYASCLGGINDFMWSLNDSGGYIPPELDTTSSPLITFWTPATAYSTTTNSMTFNVQGISFATSTINWNLQNLDTGNYYQINYPEIPVGTGDFNLSTTTLQFSTSAPNSSCGLSTGSVCPTATTTLAAGLYQGNITIVDSNGLSDSVQVSFIVITSVYGTSPNPSTGILPATDFNAATSTTGLSATNLLSFLNIPQLLKTKAPFAYIPQIQNAIQQGIGTSTTATDLPSGVINFPMRTNFQSDGSYSTTTLSIDFFSTTTVTQMLSPTLQSLMRSVMVAIVWISMGYFLWEDVRKKKHLI